MLEFPREEKGYRISGHESFPCRYTWLPKAVQGLSRDPRLFADEEKAMVDLGLGKNMVRSVELELLVKVGDREIDRTAGRREPIYAFRREEKPEISPELFVYCLNDFWQKRHGNDATLAFREVAHGHGSPGQSFKLPEDDIRTRVE